MNRTSTQLDGQSLITPELIAREFEHQHQPLHQKIAVGKAELALALEIARQQFESGVEPSLVIERLSKQLHLTRRKFFPGAWPELVDVARSHPVAAVFLEDPFTRWSFDKPRGYSGDAHLLDFIYRHPSVSGSLEQASARGRSLYEFTSNASSSVAVRERRDILTRQVDEITASRGSDAEVLTIAAGHLREAEKSNALNGGTIKRWVALDQDPLSVASMHAEYGGSCVQAMGGSVLEILTGRKKLGQFDLIYAAGLYDYLSFSVAVKLTRHCLGMLKPGGVFLFANFSDEVGVDGYMETFMNWSLLLRPESEMWKISNAANDMSKFDGAVWSGANRNVAYASLRRL
ncbi:class I SAM-dependent methyltransferase [Rhizobium sp. VS19-DR104.2]|uniref:class I SAM-dependent methyltransferase n=1 Tax=unclassified Rhizobium TaxID=2613769 RepID=UPI001C5BDF81|nr:MULTISPECIES: class I SAM-dependent methyltransferase [unclassified Rhizobium]MBZ5762429.1 class I SAM-dependent methyltransferase [Rhizobium sp. VS19-DR96]MBZ5768420.1 class I SAM-dependent methyltransferase [Rhizobium sp. VS19-DR129.2]MBZ5776074.1 class I SAM-dependent methyltransferase [Rhizobium sp. VS19-DRK62.2]MBZ5786235.1 class I SAM-dependent methyltransferase [Rhizobium sp. VS19-DR121]MBZ5804507.1 class I SAM-dependent methyltransferase [Rhizobium sp. VS19-DR181]